MAYRPAKQDTTNPTLGLHETGRLKKILNHETHIEI